MKTNRRWLKSALKQAQSSDVKMPWARGANRVAWKSRCAIRALAS